MQTSLTYSNKDVSNNTRYLIFAAYSLSFILYGFLMDPPKKILKGIYQIIIEPDVLITDYIAIGGIGAAFVNAGIIMLITLLILYVLKAEFNGNTIIALYLMGGFSLFGKNLFNIWLIILGVVLYAKLRKEPVVKYIYISFFGTSLAPIISEIFFALNLSLWSKIVVGIIVGISIGLLLPPVSTHLFHIHKGMILYNVGFAAGILGTIYVSLFRSYGFVSYSKLIWSEGNDKTLGLFMTFTFLSMLVLGYLFHGRTLKDLFRVYQYTGISGTDFVKLEGFGPTLFNMGVNGFIAMGYVFLVGGALNGPTIGGILTVMSFGAYGKHVRNIIPIFIGVILGSLTKIWNIGDPAILLAALFGTGLAPISGQYGWIFGIIAGFLNSSVVLNSGILHGGMNLYNTGFAAGIVAAVMLPVMELIKTNRRIEDR